MRLLGQPQDRQENKILGRWFHSAGTVSLGIALSADRTTSRPADNGIIRDATQRARRRLIG